MAEPSKILTVSYGTFSCTLEGFDDAFDTMKAIAEYFRDLAADDRYFGAEPPTPDPEMLARIAEREVERRVEARLERGAYVLRPAALTTTAGAAAAGVSGLAPWPRPDAAQTEEPAALAESGHDRSDMAGDAHARLETPEAIEGTSAEDESGPQFLPGTPDDGSATEIADRDAAVMDSAEDAITAAIKTADFDEIGIARPDTDATVAETQAPNDDGSTDEAQDQMAAEAEAEADREPVSDTQDDAPREDDEEMAPGPAAATETEARPETEAVAAAEIGFGDEPDPIETKPWEDLTVDERRELRRRRRAERAERAERAGAMAESSEVGEDPSAGTGTDDAVTAETAPDAGTPDLQDAAQAETGPETAADADEDASVAAKLARIRAVVGIGTAALATGGDIEDESDHDAEPTTDRDLDALRSMIRQNEEIGGTDVPTAETRDVPVADAGLTHAETTPRGPEEAVAAPIRARVVKMRRSDFEARYGEAGPTEDQSAPMPPVETGDPDARTLGDTAGSMDLARLDVLQVQDASGHPTVAEANSGLDTEAALADLARLDGLEDYDAPPPEITDPSSSLSPDAEAELMEELAEVERMALAEEADLEGEDTSSVASGIPGFHTEAAASDDVGAQSRESRATLLAAPPEADEAAISRILTETDAQLNEPEASRRREAIAHLKAAVAATEAARQLGEDRGEGDEDSENMFRDDLDQVVRPRRTPRPLTRSERPRPAPLKLVASQRVDAPPATASDTGPVLPRRVETEAAVPDAAEAAAQERFARFASDMGTAGLSDMIEAAAAHAIFNEGEEDVSRPQLMRLVQAIVPGEFSREDGLRAFGTLLRQGRLEKVRNGRFRVSPQTRFNPRRAASGS